MPAIPNEEQIPPEFLVEAQRLTGWKNNSLATALGMDQSSVSNWRTGRQTLSRSRWMAVKVAMGIPEDWEPGKPLEKFRPPPR